MNLFASLFFFCCSFIFLSDCDSKNCERDLNTVLICGWTSTTIKFFLGIVAESLPPLKVEFHLYTNKNPSYHQKLTFGDKNSVIQSNFISDADTKILVHGYNGSPKQGFYLELKSALLSNQEVNVILVDWTKDASEFYYPGAIINAYRCGKQIAKMIQFLQEVANLTLGQIHLIGFSLGGQVVGYTGKRLDKIARISAIDPAGVCFDGFPPKYRLNRTDADFIDILSTTVGEISTAIPVGHINVYLNGGHIQPGCAGEVLHHVREDIFSGYTIFFDNCSHTFAIEFYTETILNPNCKPIAYRCSDFESFSQGECADCGDQGEDCALAGIEAKNSENFQDDDSDRIFHLKTSGNSPLCLFHYQVTLTIDKSQNHSVYGKSVVSFLGIGGKNVTSYNKRLDLYESENSYTHLINSKYDILPVTKAWLFWYFYPIYEEEPQIPTIAVKSLKLKPMNSPERLLKQESSLRVYTFCTKKNQLIPPGQKIALFLDENC